MKAPENTTSPTTFLPFLWVTQEILKSLPSNPPWKQTAQQARLQELEWNDHDNLQTYTTENTRLILSHSRLILSYQPFRKSLEHHGQLNRKLFAKILQRRGRISDAPPSPTTTSSTSVKEREGKAAWKPNFQLMRKMLTPMSRHSEEHK